MLDLVPIPKDDPAVSLTIRMFLCSTKLNVESLIMDARSAMRPCYIYLRAVGRQVLWSSACVCLSVCLSVCVCAHCFCPQDISRTGSWITTKFGGWEQGVNL